MEKKIADVLPAVTVYCGSSVGDREAYAEAARSMGEALAKEGIRLIYGGGQRGLMGVVADSVLEHGGEVTGIIPHFMVQWEWEHKGVKDMIKVENMSDRKEQLLSLGSGLIALPGGVGTLEEFSEAISWSQLLIHRKPIGFLNVEGYFDLFLEFFHHIIEEGFANASVSELIIVADDPRELLYQMATFQHNGEVKTSETPE